MLLRTAQPLASKAHNRITEAEFTLAQKPNQTYSPENSLSSFSGALFWASKTCPALREKYKNNMQTNIINLSNKMPPVEGMIPTPGKFKVDSCLSFINALAIPQTVSIKLFSTLLKMTVPRSKRKTITTQL